MAQNEGRTLRRAPKLFTRYITMFMVMLTVATTLGLAVHELKVAAEAVLITQNAQAKNPASNNGSQATGQLAALASQATVSGDTSGVPSCTRGHYTLPSTIDLAGLPEGVTVIEDAPQQYVIYGNTVDEQQQQLQRCAPVDDFSGAASYQVSWQYGYSVRADGLCEIVDPKIGLHLNMIMPRWSATDAATAETRNTWQAFMTGLTIHEKGHYAISRRYADTMLKQLQTLSPQNCATVKTSVDTLIASKLQQLQTTQENYDAATGHGATQGASL